MPTPPPRRIDGLDDPWGFGVPDGTLVELDRDLVNPVVARPRSPAVPPSPAPPPPPRAPVASPVPPSHHIFAAPQAAAQPVGGAHEPAADALLRPRAVHGPPSQHFPPRRRGHRVMSSSIAVGLLALSALGGYAWFAEDIPWPTRRGAPVDALPHGVFVLSSQPPGAEVLVDGVASGVTPLALNLTAGSHIIVATGTNGASQQITAAVPAGDTAARHLVLEPVAAAEPLAAPPPVDPASLPDAPPVALPSFVSFDAPFDVQVYENGTFLGSTGGERLRVSPGRHVFTLVNEPFGFRLDEVVVVGAGRSVRRVINRPSASLSVNADPWAEVFISGRSFGETPLANISLPVGSYAMTLRHPTLGDRDVTTIVRADRPNRVAVDMRR